MPYHYLAAFILTSRHASFSKAARELGVAQSAVSRQIKLLEESLGHQLLVRSSKKVILTREGEELFQAAQDFDNHLRTVFGESRQEEIRVGVLHGVLETWGVSFLEQYINTQPSNLVIQVDHPQKLVDGLLSRAHDLIMTNENIQNELVSSLKLFQEELVLISSAKIALADVPKHRWITYDQPDWLHLHFKPAAGHRFIRVNSMTAVVNLVRHGLGIAIVPTHVLGDDRRLHRQAVPRIQNPTVYISTLNYQRIPKRLKTLVELLKQRVPA